MYFTRSICKRTSKGSVAQRISALNPTPEEQDNLNTIWGKTALSFRDVEYLLDLYSSRSEAVHIHAAST
jgi:hypothetical protein